MLTVSNYTTISSGSAEYLEDEYGEGDGKIWLENLKCTGKETTLLECEKTDFGVHWCSHSDDVSISCSHTEGTV